MTTYNIVKLNHTIKRLEALHADLGSQMTLKNAKAIAAEITHNDECELCDLAEQYVENMATQARKNGARVCLTMAINAMNGAVVFATKEAAEAKGMTVTEHVVDVVVTEFMERGESLEGINAAADEAAAVLVSKWHESVADKLILKWSLSGLIVQEFAKRRSEFLDSLHDEPEEEEEQEEISRGDIAAHVFSGSREDADNLETLVVFNALAEVLTFTGGGVESARLAFMGAVNLCSYDNLYQIEICSEAKTPNVIIEAVLHEIVRLESVVPAEYADAVYNRYEAKIPQLARLYFNALPHLAHVDVTFNDGVVTGNKVAGKKVNGGLAFDGYRQTLSLATVDITGVQSVEFESKGTELIGKVFTAFAEVFK